MTLLLYLSKGNIKYLSTPQPSTKHLFRRRSLPEQPSERGNELQASSHPKRRLPAPTTATQPTTHNSANKQSHNTTNATIPLHVRSGLIRNLRIRRNIKVNTGEN